MAVALTVAITAILVGVCAAYLVQRWMNAAFIDAIGGRADADPVDEHRRILGQSEKKLTEATSRTDMLERALDALTTGVIVTDHAGLPVFRNRFASNIASRPHEQTLVEAKTSELLAAAVKGNGGEREVELFGPPPRVLLVHAVPITTGVKVLGALVVIDDVTDHYRIDKTRRDFIANLSHELRTPVGAVSLLSEMMVGEDDPATRSQLTDRLLIECDRMTETIDDLLELSRIESEEQSYDDVFVVQGVVDEAMSRTRVLAEGASVQVGVVAPGTSITMVGNRSQLVVALVNLIENAIKYSFAGGSVSVRSRLDDDMLALVVQDAGRGIPARDLDRIFERFYRVDRSRDVSTGGSGIGLSIVRHVALNHGGTVGVESFEGEGSTFTMLLPVGMAPQPGMPQPGIGHEAIETTREVH